MVTQKDFISDQTADERLLKEIRLVEEIVSKRPRNSIDIIVDEKEVDQKKDT